LGYNEGKKRLPGTLAENGYTFGGVCRKSHPFGGVSRENALPDSRKVAVKGEVMGYGGQLFFFKSESFAKGREALRVIKQAVGKIDLAFIFTKTVGKGAFVTAV
jgi:hypothetical protein